MKTGTTTTNRSNAILCLLVGLMLSIAFMLSGCSLGGKSKPANFYVLTALPEDTETIVPAEVEIPQLGVGQVQIPAFLDRPQMVTSVAENQIALSEFNRWGESFQAGITRVFRENLAVLLGGAEVSAFPWLQPFPRDYVIHLVVLEFEAATYRDEIFLRVMYRITDSKQTESFIVEEVEYTRPIQGDEIEGYSRIADAMSKTLEDLSRDIAEQVTQLPLLPQGDN
ncbi:PqiC family protein [Rubellicoccus peritrichatus]|uniref:PqiC family protein n=1 Tax=Rubellicoccus peritrichatus TaxID=3080537 RepID=A0AAQ3LBV3_9BACT|nr:PqiC family protein [Puniceicoccus sp. CR14]WOO42890.1 PqiC family protein [Puniceicoccus sp. CR14]